MVQVARYFEGSGVIPGTVTMRTIVCLFHLIALGKPEFTLSPAAKNLPRLSWSRQKNASLMRKFGGGQGKDGFFH